MNPSFPQQDLRWKQRFDHFKAAFDQFRLAVELSKQRPLTELEMQGLIQAFEFTHELAWNVLKDYFFYQGNSQITGSRDATREGFKNEILDNGEIWMEMITSRNQTTHTYNKEVSSHIINQILNQYFQQFQLFLEKMNDLSKKS